MNGPEALEVSVHIAARPDVVFPYFTDPDRYVRWMGTDATIEPAPGGTYRVFIRDGVETSGEFLEIDPPKRVVFTWGWHGDPAVPPGSTRVEITFEEEDTGTRVRLRHHGLPDQDQRDQHGAGWRLYLGRLAAWEAGTDPGPDPNTCRPPRSS